MEQCTLYNVQIDNVISAKHWRHAFQQALLEIVRIKPVIPVSFDVALVLQRQNS